MNDCRLCAGRTKYVWRHAILGKYDVEYFECENCGSLQTAEPYWLDEAYSDPGAGFDTGACQRSVDSALAISATLEFLGLRQDCECLDFGAGFGLFARMMRDRGWNYFAYEKNHFPYYMDRFLAEPRARNWDVISAFEVFEHLPNPAETLDQILGSAREYVFFSTELFQRQGRDWYYLNPLHGQHVFFYSQRALAGAGQTYGFEFHDLGFAKCFSRPNVREKMLLISQRDFTPKILESFLRHQQDPYRHAARDQADLLKRSGP